jgi:hypothetical protein
LKKLKRRNKVNQTLTQLNDNELVDVLMNNTTNGSTVYINPGSILPYTTIPYQTLPYHPITWTTYNSPIVNSYVTVDKAENGFIITKNNKKYVAKKAEEVVKYLKEEEK